MPRQAVVCGAANGGVGFALAEYLRLELKLDVCLVDIDAARLARLPATYKSVACDVGSLEQVAALPAKVARAFEPMLLDLAYVVNCSAVFANSQDPVHTAPRSWAMAFRINLVGAFAFQQAFLPLLLASALPSRVIHCGSLAALTGGAGEPYVSSKVALLQMCESTARALASDPKSRHVSCHIIMPGVVQTQFAASSVRAQNLHQASCTSEAALNPSAPAPNSGSFAGDDASKHVFGHMMSLGLLPGQIAQQVFERLAWDNAFMIVCDNSPAIDLAKALDERARALLSGAVPAVDVPPIVLEARRRAGL